MWTATKNEKHADLKRMHFSFPMDSWGVSPWRVLEPRAPFSERKDRWVKMPDSGDSFVRVKDVRWWPADFAMGLTSWLSWKESSAHWVGSLVLFRWWNHPPKRYRNRNTYFQESKQWYWNRLNTEFQTFLSMTCFFLVQPRLTTTLYSTKWDQDPERISWGWPACLDVVFLGRRIT